MYYTLDFNTYAMLFRAKSEYDFKSITCEYYFIIVQNNLTRKNAFVSCIIRFIYFFNETFLNSTIFSVFIRILYKIWILILFSGTDFFVMIITLLFSVFLSLEIGIFIGIALNLLFLLYFSARPIITTNIVNVSKHLTSFKSKNFDSFQ